MFEKTLEIGEILEEFEDNFAGLEFGIEFIFVEGGDVVVEFVDYGLLPCHRFKSKL